MNLKESFRYEKFLTNLFNEGRRRLMEKPTYLEYVHHRHAAYPKHKDETLIEEGNISIPGNDIVLSFLLYVIKEKEHLGEAIRTAKQNTAGMADVELQLNAMRRALYGDIRRLMEYEAETVVHRDEGIGHFIGEDGEQKDYKYDIDHVTKLNFPRNKFGETATSLIRKAESVSNYIEKQLVDTTVDYDPPFEVFCCFQDALELYFRKLAG